MISEHPEDFVSLVESGDRRALAKAISAVEDQTSGAHDLLSGFYAAAGDSRRIGITGAPGVGKSTLTSRLIETIRSKGNTVAVAAVDPSSPFTGGAVLGDRIRMQEHVDDPGVYVRSLAGRGHLGGISAALPKVAVVMEGAGFDYLIIETVGVGQAEVDIMVEADTTVVVVTPGWGDGIQAGKAGLLEIGDLFVINKADRPGIAETRRDLETMLNMGAAREWKPPVVETVATASEGMDTLWEALNDHFVYLQQGELAARRTRRIMHAIQEEIREVASRRLVSGRLAGLEEMVELVRTREMDPWSAARRFFQAQKLESAEITGLGINPYRQ